MKYEIVDQNETIQSSDRFYFREMGNVIIQELTIAKVENKDKWTHTNGQVFANYIQIIVTKVSLQ